MLSQSQKKNAAIPASSGAFGSRVMELASRLADISESPDALTCTYMTPAHRAAALELKAWMQAARMTAEIDAVGNVVGRYAAADTNAKTLILASHYDTVRNAGKYDGRLGILLALVVIEHLIRTARQLPFHVELIGFAEEEGVRFGTAYLGSSAVAGRFDGKMLERKDAAGVSVAETIRAGGGNPADIPNLARKPESLLGYLEVHIEQGPVLLEQDLPVGVVTAIAGAARYTVIITGTAGHAGTVPMASRHDAAVAAAEVVLCVERICKGIPGAVGTVGQITVPNGAVNVIPGRCELSLDIRADDGGKLNAAIKDVFAEIEQINGRRGVCIEAAEIQRTPVVSCSPRLQQLLADSVARAGIRPYRLPSGAGHDAVTFDGVTEVGMLFVRCGNGGISHSPLETVSADDVEVVARILLDTLMSFDGPL
jgi:allantoate deiminase/N-carbamoyl-L-amino-acid hydrolase